MNKLFCLIGMFFTCGVCDAQNFANGSVELWGIAGTCETNTPPDNWTSYTTAGADPDEGNLTICPSTIPPVASNGNVYARCVTYPSGGEGMYQNISGFTIGNIYQLSYDYSGSNLYGGTDDISWHLFIDDVDVDQTSVFHSTDSNWTMHSYNFTATLAMHKIGLRLFLMTGTAGSGGMDNFMLTNITGIGNNIPGYTILASPNPFKNNLNIEVNNNSASEILLYDITSRKILQEQFISSVSLNTAQLAKGIYIYELRNKNRVIKKGKVVKD